MYFVSVFQIEGYIQWGYKIRIIFYSNQKKIQGSKMLKV